MFREPEQFTAVPQLSDFGLTERELEVLKQLSTGLKYEQIAQNLFLSVGTVRKHVENIYAKLHVHNKLEAISMARQHQLI
jgi:DNA-binding NarL/FixJ family response regulator